MLKFVEYSVIAIAMYGLVASLISMFNTNEKIERIIYASTGIVSIFSLIIITIYLILVV